MRAGSPICCLRSLTRSALVAFSAGPRLKRTVAIRQNRNVTPRTVRSGRNLTTKEKLVEPSRRASECSSRSLHQTLMTSPTKPPQIASSKPSQSNWRTIRQRDAPTARRSAISFERAVPRASSMFARFKLAISRTAPAIPISSAPIRVTGPSSSGEVLILNRDGS